MTWIINETVTAGNSTARIKNYYPLTGLVVLYDIKGDIKAGSTIVGSASGTSLTLSNFTISDEYDLGYEPTFWTEFINSVGPGTAIYDGNGEYIVPDEYINSPTLYENLLVTG